MTGRDGSYTWVEGDNGVVELGDGRGRLFSPLRRLRRWWLRRRVLHRAGRPLPRWAAQSAAALLIFALLAGLARLPYPWADSAVQGVSAVLAADATAAWVREARAVPTLGRAMAAWVAGTGQGLSPGAGTSASGAGAVAEGGAGAPAGALPTGLGPLAWPAVGALVSGFGFRGQGDDPEYHQGIDIAAEAGSAVRAIAAGQVVGVDRSPAGSGEEVIVAHAYGWTSVYRHILVPEVRVGEQVERGAVLGTLAAGGDDGAAAGGLLHFELRQGDQPLDPAPYLGLLDSSGT